jgi:hypothetical protein
MKYSKTKTITGVLEVDKILFESKAWEIVYSEGMIFLVNKRLKSEGRYDQDVEVTAETIETAEIKGVKIPKYIRKELAGIFAEIASQEVVATQEQDVEIVSEEPKHLYKAPVYNLITNEYGSWQLEIGKEYDLLLVAVALDINPSIPEYPIYKMEFIDYDPTDGVLRFYDKVLKTELPTEVHISRIKAIQFTEVRF